ncbi:MAG TPA: pyrrolo-quinoline quinone, partial [Candidatus Sulfotelmatobacter sp.]|nr:pyrrolo-quinoline quinone [Candidatus Sulfotelmatobacter sp.]
GNGGPGLLHAYDGTTVTHELWNSNMTAADNLGTGIAFAVPVIANGRVIVTSDKSATVYGVR